MVILKTEKLIKVYGAKDSEVRALDSVDFTVEKGEFVAVTGPSGSGKSTLLHLLAGLDTPSSGKVIIGDTDIFSLKESDMSKFRRRNIGFIFQFFNLIPILSVKENIKLPILMDNKKPDNEYVEDLMKSLNIKEREKHLPGQLSGGQQQRVAIARALVNKPSIIFADEPTGNLDSKNTDEVITLLRDTIKKYGQTLVMITHDMDIAKKADRIVTILDGKIQKDEKVMI